jgi:hypothetical protein
MDNLYCTWDLSTTSRFSFLKQSLGSSRRLWISMFWELCGSVCTCLHMGHTLNHQAYLWWTLRILSKLWRYGPEVENSVQMADLPKVTAAPQRKMQPRLCQGKEFCSHMCYIELTFKDFSYFYKWLQDFFAKKTSFRSVIVQNASLKQATPGQDRNIKLTLRWLRTMIHNCHLHILVSPSQPKWNTWH